MLQAMLVVCLLLLMLATAPAWPYSRSWGFLPSSMIGAILVMVLLLLFVGGS
jgi:hypothetical protein